MNARYGIAFWAGAGVYCVINILMNAKGISQDKVLTYNYLIAAVAVLGLTLNLVILRRSKRSGQ